MIGKLLSLLGGGKQSPELLSILESVKPLLAMLDNDSTTPSATGEKTQFAEVSEKLEPVMQEAKNNLGQKDFSKLVGEILKLSSNGEIKDLIKKFI